MRGAGGGGADLVGSGNRKKLARVEDSARTSLTVVRRRPAARVASPVRSEGLSRPAEKPSVDFRGILTEKSRGIGGDAATPLARGAADATTRWKTRWNAFEFGCPKEKSVCPVERSEEEGRKKGRRTERESVSFCELALARSVETEEVSEMLAASICREVHFTVLSSTTMASRVPRCLFGKPNPRETVEMLHEALDAERSKFAKRWGVDPRSEDKENSYQRKHHDKYEQSPKKRSNPYSRQTSIHDYWRARKVCEVNKKPLASSADAVKQQTESSKSSKTMIKSSKKTAQN